MGCTTDGVLDKALHELVDADVAGSELGSRVVPADDAFSGLVGRWRKLAETGGTQTLPAPTVDFAEHGKHIFEVVVVEEPHVLRLFVLLKRHCEGGGTWLLETWL